MGINKLVNLKIPFDKTKILYKIEAIFLLFLPILITIDKYIGIAGTILTGIPFVIGLLSVLIYQKSKIVKYVIIFLLLGLNIFLENDFKEQFEFIKPLLIFITCFDMAQDVNFLSTIDECFRKHRKFIIISITLVIVLNIGFIIFSNSTSSYSEAWNINAFEGLYDDPHQAAYRFCSLIVYVMFLTRIEKNSHIINLALLILCEGLLLKTGARTPTLLGIALGMLTIYFMKDKIKEQLAKNRRNTIALLMVAMIVIIVVSIIYIPKTAFVQKIIVSASGTFDNGRESLRNVEWNYFVNSDIKNKMIGNSADKIYSINFSVIHNRIWCHSDIMQILLQFGIFMLIIYFETIIRAMIFHLKNQTRFSKFTIILLNLTFLFVAFYNGLFFHPRFVVSIPIIFTVYKLYSKDEKAKREGENQ